MAYFDSPKNKALWYAELSRLKDERDARTQGKAAKSLRGEGLAGAVNKEGLKIREKVSFDELVKEEYPAMAANQGERDFSFTLKDPEFSIPVKESAEIKAPMTPLPEFSLNGTKTNYSL